MLPRITIAALKGGSGKTILSLGLIAAWREQGRRVAVFKKGPDFIDAGWLSFAAGRDCHNLDPFMMSDPQMTHSFFEHSRGAHISLIEGNRGLFDGLDLEGCCSTAQLGRLLKTPVLLLADVTMVTRTVAALIMGCQTFDPELHIAGIILNRVAGARQESLVRNSIERYCHIPVLGAVPKLKGNLFPERHMGLIPHQEREQARKAVSWARKAVEENLDMEAIWNMARRAEPLHQEPELPHAPDHPFERDADPPTIGCIRDRAFWFYYPENLAHLRRLGARVVDLDAMKDEKLSGLDALYLGGGFPETQAEALAQNRTFRQSLREKIEDGLPVYAECGGLMYLGENLVLGDHTYPMVGALPMDLLLEKKPQGHGYTILDVTGDNPYYPVGETLRGHEFHYSRPIWTGTEEMHPVFQVRRGHGLDGKVDGLCKNNLLATYTHLHAGGNTMWGESLVGAARSRKGKSRKNSGDRKKKD
jgi:cobyrinic acid a,c-diamide synthase